MNSHPQLKLQLAILHEAQDTNEISLANLSGPVEWLRCRMNDQGTFEFFFEDELLSAIDPAKDPLALPNLAGILILGGNDFFERVKTTWSSNFPAVNLSYQHIADSGIESILSGALQCMAEGRMNERRHAGKISLQLAEYRREFDRVQHSFARLEQQIGLQPLQRSIPIFELLPDYDPSVQEGRRRAFACAAISNGDTLAQFLPVDSFGFSSVSICIGSTPERPTAPLLIRLHAMETDKTLATWVVDEQASESGWILLTLHRALDERALSLKLTLENQDESGSWNVVLGPPHPHPYFCAQTAEGLPLSSPIAMRVFAGLPGVVVPAVTNMLRPVEEVETHTIFLSEELCMDTEQVTPIPQHDKQALVFYDPGIQTLTVHPHYGGITVGRIQACIPNNCWGISAQIQLAHEKASPTDFGLFVCAQTQEVIPEGIDKLEMPSQSFSGWRRLSPMETGAVTLVISSAQSKDIWILLMTKQDPDASPDFGWARFSQLRFNILPSTCHVSAASLQTLEVSQAHSVGNAE